MQRMIAVFIFEIVAIALLWGCSIGSSPESTVEQFYKYLNAGEYSRAKELYSAGSKKRIGVEAVEMDSPFTKWADKETRNGTIDKVRIIDSEERGEGASVEYSISFKDGTTVTKTVRLTKENGAWQMELVPD